MKSVLHVYRDFRRMVRRFQIDLSAAVSRIPTAIFSRKKPLVTDEFESVPSDPQKDGREGPEPWPYQRPWRTPWNQSIILSAAKKFNYPIDPVVKMTA